jgi:hypothetical protein
LIDDYSRLERNKTTKRREQKTSPALVNTCRFVVFKRKLRTLNSSKLSTLLLLRPRKFLIDPSRFSIHNNDNYDKRTYVTIRTSWQERKKKTNKIPDLWKKKEFGISSSKIIPDLWKRIQDLFLQIIPDLWNSCSFLLLLLLLLLLSITSMRAQELDRQQQRQQVLLRKPQQSS